MQALFLLRLITFFISFVITLCNEPLVSPRKKIESYLASQGCTNGLVAHYVIMAAKHGIAASEIYAEIKYAMPVGTLLSQVTKWFVNLTNLI